MSKISNVPQIRFKGFTDAWEQRKLAELFVNSGSGATPKSTNKDFYDGDIPFLSIADIKGREISETAKMITQKGLESSAAWLVPKGALSLAMYASVGKIGILNKSMATSQAFFNMVFDNEACRDFVYTRLEKAELFNEWESYISTGTQRNLNAEKVKRFKICVPESHETARIANIFSQIDNYITLHQRKYDQVVNFKKAMLEKMFPKDGCETPEIRFKDFSGEKANAWQEKSLLEESDVIGTGKSKFNLNESGPYEILGSTSVIGYDDNYDYEGDFILIARVGANAGELYRFSGKVKISDNTVFIQGNKINFIYYLLVKSNLKRLSFGTGQPLVKASELKDKVILVPQNVEEREQIGVFFEKLDKVISLYHHKLQKLNNLKKALLEKMFV